MVQTFPGNVAKKLVKPLGLVLRPPLQLRNDCLAMLADRNSLAAIQRNKGVSEEMVNGWLEVAANMSSR